MVEPAKRPIFTVGRYLDVLVVLVVAFVAWKVFLAPRMFKTDAKAQPAPHVVYQRLDGSSFALAAQQGHLVFLDFFASWCEPCRLELPMVERYAREHPEIEVVPVDVGEPSAVAASYAQKLHLGNVALDPKSTAQGFFAVEGFPTVVVVDPQGKIRASWSGLNPAIELAMSNAEKKLK
jgi:thiol-disulfide isomerase/thioredoxin